MDVSELIISLLWLIAVFLIARLALLIIKAPKRIDDLEKQLRKLNSRIAELEIKEKK